MEEKLRQIIRENKCKFLAHESHELYNRFNTICFLIPSDDAGTSFSLNIICGGGSSENNEIEPLMLYNESFEITVEEFKTLITNCSEKYAGQLEVCIPDMWALFCGVFNDPTVENVIELIDEAVSEEDWSLGKGGIGFNVVDRTM